MTQLEAGHYYLNRHSDCLQILTKLTPEDPLYRLGLRFQDSVGRCYRDDGIANSDGSESRWDLVSEIVINDDYIHRQKIAASAHEFTEEFFQSDAYNPNSVTRKQTVEQAIQFVLDKIKYQGHSPHEHVSNSSS